MFTKNIKLNVLFIALLTVVAFTLPIFVANDGQFDTAVADAFGGGPGGGGSGGGDGGGGGCGGCGGGSDGGGRDGGGDRPFVPPTPSCEFFTIAETSVAPEADLSFAWGTTNVTAVSFNNGIGSQAVDGNRTFRAPATPGTYTYTLTFNGLTNGSCVDTIIVETPAVPVCEDPAANNTGDALPCTYPISTCDFFTIAETNVAPEAPLTFAWGTTNVTAVSFNNSIGSQAVDGNRTFRAPATTGTYTYTLTFDGLTNSTCVDTVVVETPAVPVCEDTTANNTGDALPCTYDAFVPQCVSFTASAATITVGESITLTWDTLNATQILIDNAVGDVTSIATKSTTVSPIANTTYQLTVIGAAGTVPNTSCTIPVTVKPVVAPSTPDISIDKNDTDNKDDTQQVAVGGTATFAIVVTNTGNEDLVNVVVTDPLEPACNKTIGALAIGASDTYTCNSTNVRAAFTNVANVTGDSAVDGEVVTDTDPTRVTIPTGGGGGGGGGSSSPRCELEISETKITRGEKVTLTWETRSTRELILTDDRGNVIVTTENKLSDDKDELFDSKITLTPTRDTTYTLRVERGSRDRECEVQVELDDEIVLLQVRDQAPLVSGISLTQVPYTGFEAGSVMTFMFYALLAAWALYITYILVIPKNVLATAPVLVTPRTTTDLMASAESIRPDVFAPLPTKSVVASQATAAAAPANLPVAAPVLVEEAPVVADTLDVVTEVENEAHLHQALLSSGAVQSFIAMTTEADRSDKLAKVIADAKGSYPLEDGWVVINQTRLTELTAAPVVATDAVTGSGSLAEAIVTGNVSASYQMIGDRPMVALADAAADLDALYRNRKGANESVSDLLTTATAALSDTQIADMINALTGALDGTYTDEASAVKMAIMKAVKVTA